MPIISADGLTFTLKLRPHMKFADGMVLTAPMYASQLKRLMSVGPTCPDGVADVLVTPFVESISAPDDTTLVFKLKQKTAFFPMLLATSPYVASHPPTFPDDKCALLPAAPVYGVGPWYIKEYSPAGEFVLEPNPYYVINYRAQVDQVILRNYTDLQALASALQDGEIDIAWPLDNGMIEQLVDDLGIKVVPTPGGRLQFLSINHSLAPMDDPNVVKAIAASIDRIKIIDTVYKGNATPLYSIIPPGLLGATEAFDTLYKAPNLDLTKQLLQTSGYSQSNSLSLDLGIPPSTKALRRLTGWG